MDLQDFKKTARKVKCIVDDINALRKIIAKLNCNEESEIPSMLRKNESALFIKIKDCMCDIELIAAILENCVELVPKRLQPPDEEASELSSYGYVGAGVPEEMCLVTSDYFMEFTERKKVALQKGYSLEEFFEMERQRDEAIGRWARSC